MRQRCVLLLPLLFVFDKQAPANNVDPDQTPQNPASDQGLQFATHTSVFGTTGSKMELLTFRISKVRG